VLGCRALDDAVESNVGDLQDPRPRGRSLADQVAERSGPRVWPIDKSVKRPAADDSAGTLMVSDLSIDAAMVCVRAVSCAIGAPASFENRYASGRSYFSEVREKPRHAVERRHVTPTRMRTGSDTVLDVPRSIFTQGLPASPRAGLSASARDLRAREDIESRALRFM